MRPVEPLAGSSSTRICGAETGALAAGAFTGCTGLSGWADAPAAGAASRAGGCHATVPERGEAAVSVVPD
jgi:hypothetical protein